MPYRVRKIDWNLLLQPYMAGLNAQARSDELKKHRNAESYRNLGNKFRTRRQEKESNRRYDQDFGLREDALDLRRENTKTELDLRRDRLNLDRADMLSDMQEKQAYSESIAAWLAGTGPELIQASQEENPSPQTQQRVATLADHYKRMVNLGGGAKASGEAQVRYAAQKPPTEDP